MPHHGALKLAGLLESAMRHGEAITESTGR